MDTLTIYAITVGALLLLLITHRLLNMASHWRDAFRAFFCRHMVYPCVISRHYFFGPWSRIVVCFYLVYMTLNSVVLFYNSHTISLESVGRRAGSLSIVNMIFPLLAGHLSHSADLLGLSLTLYRKIHRASGWMAIGLVILHAGALYSDMKISSSVSDGDKLFVIIAAGCLGALGLTALPLVRRISFEIFIRVHQGLTIVCVYGIWRHIPKDSLLPELYILIGVSLFATTSSTYLIKLLYRNGIFSGNGCPRAILSSSNCDLVKDREKAGALFNIRLLLPRPVTVKAGQYINLWLPSATMGSWMQTHPFTIISWSQKPQSSIELLIQPRKGLTATLAHQVQNAGPRGYSCLAVYSGPHGLSEPVESYETVLLVANEAGLSAVLPYAKKLIHGYNTCTSHVRRVHLLWQMMTYWITATISIYVGEGAKLRDIPFGRHERAFLYQGVPDYSSIISGEVSGENIDKTSRIRDTQGKLLIMGQVRDRLRNIIRGHLDQDIRMAELEYQL
ncbi:uncharacterized protein N7483_002503 [Penicillium malachiteum]|uniref:uncharacterized protein n=1 Tax=Penicillium malachiteum TaxID=1324776 RepID=UPI0025485B73|nr:uncharacterized protein N7483_002396 [Penicillium malachiteum]XP_056952089.1 uncharacterized protein N7483_002503 [Penicillium malachiteum]KAJ5737271.1 hypothetical protein N7483_002396 [Penicillium malachiteum]KAJ5737378.1 hypothetical protein N7483_002503 [Penicillium malachiteum]